MYSGPAPTGDPGRPTYPAAGLDRRFYAFVLDRLIAWSLYAVAGYAAYLLLGDDRPWTVVGVVAGVVLLVSAVHVVLLGAAGVSAGKAATGLRVVRHDAGKPIGVGLALLRTLVLGLSALPTVGLGVATLAWTALMDPSRSRRGWHDRVTDSVVVDVRPAPTAPADEEQVERPRQVVNLTAMRLMPAPEPQAAPEPEPVPDRATDPATPVPADAPASAQPPARVPDEMAPPEGVPGALPSGTPPPPPPPPPVAATPTPPAPRSPEPRTVPPATSSSSGAWRVTFDTGETLTVDGLALVGRRPQPRRGEHADHLLALRSEDMSLSKTHAQFQAAPDGALVVMDRGSTNGSMLIRQGVAKQLSAGRPATLIAGDRVRFGDREMSVDREE